MEVAVHQELTLTCPNGARYARTATLTTESSTPILVITLNGERFELEQPMSVTSLLAKLEIDPRRVAIEHNLTIIKRQRFADVLVSEGDRVEIVNFVGGG